MVLWFYYWWTGFLLCQMKRGEGEQLINYLTERGLPVWDIRRSPGERLWFALRAKDFLEICSWLRANGFRVAIERKSGLPFFLARLRTRFFFWAGGIAFGVGVLLFTQVVWSVSVVGGERTSAQQVLDLASEAGLKPGVFRFRLPNRDALQDEMLRRIPGLSWVGIERQGIHMRIHIVETPQVEKLPLQNPRHLVSSKEAVVKEIFVEQGLAQVKRNQRVRRGQILVSGLIGEEEQVRAITARGRVKGWVWYESDVTVPMERVQRTLTGEQRERFGLRWAEKTFFWEWSRTEPYASYVTESVHYNFNWFGREFPLGWQRERISETQESKTRISEAEAVRIGLQSAREDILKQTEKTAEIAQEEILQRKIENGKVYLKVYFEVIEEIAVEQPIVQGE